MDILKGNRFGADMTMTQRVVFVPSNRKHAFAIVLNDNAAHGFA
jgi:hypothetical protein